MNARTMTLVIDPSSSLTKGLYRIGDESPRKLETMLPEVIEISRDSYEAYRRERLDNVPAYRDASLKIGNKYYALGHLAIQRFGAVETLKENKVERSIQRVLAMVGTIVKKERYCRPDAVEINLGILLPFGEFYGCKDEFADRLRKNLKNFQFREKEYSVTVNCLLIRPEGWGVYDRTIPDPRKERVDLVICAGFRNISYLVISDDQVIFAETSDFGFSGMLRMLARYLGKETSQNTEKWRELIEIVNREEKSKSPLGRRIRAIRREYWNQTSNWFDSRNFPRFHEIVVTGGTAEYLKPELTEYFSGYTLNWADRLEKEVETIAGDQWKSEEYRGRFTDLYGFHEYVEIQSFFKNLARA